MKESNPVTGLQTGPQPNIFKEAGGRGLPTRTFKDRLTLGRGNDRVELYYFGRAHTSGDAFVLFPALRVLHSGDAFAAKGVPIMDANNGRSGVEYPETLSKAAKLPNVDTVITGTRACHDDDGRCEGVRRVQLRVPGPCARREEGHNLAWKLALVLKGVAGAPLLDTYQAERRPASAFTVEQAYTRYVTRTAPFLGKTDYQPLADDFDIELGYLYRSAAIAPRPADDVGGETHEHPSRSFGRPGSRAPHVWLERKGERMSTLDLFRGAFVLLAGSNGSDWIDAARLAGEQFPGLPLEAYRIGADIADGGGFAAAYDLSPSGATLVRPDGFVAWRAVSSGSGAEAELASTLTTILMRS